MLSFAAISAAQEIKSPPSADQRPLQVRLGYPADAKLLILNADDLAVTHSENDASFKALDQKWITSATVMVPCPWFTEVAQYAKAHPQADLGLHLTFTSEWKTYRWGPVASRSLVPSLVGPDGYFYPDTAIFAQHAKPEEVEIELRAQIERAKSMGLDPSHLDAHMHALYATPQLFAVFLKVAHEYKLPIRMARNDPAFIRRLDQMAPGEPVCDAILTPLEDVQPAQWLDFYVNLVKNLKPGVTEVFVHLAHDDAESQAVMVDHDGWGSAWRQRETDVISSPEFRKVLDENHVVLIGWRQIKSLL
jgi:chitin disaccharide deacetylase